MAIFNILDGPATSVGLSYPHFTAQVNEVHEKNGLLEYPCVPLRAYARSATMRRQAAIEMQMDKIADFSEQEYWIIETTLRERYGEAVEIQLADAELRLNPHQTEMTLCPTLFWEYEDCHFVIFKIGDNRFKGQFYYRLFQMYGTGQDEYDDISECVVTLLQVQSDHARNEEQEQDAQ